MAVWGYARGSFLKGQQTQIEEYATKHGMTLDGIMTEPRGVWGSIPVADRPAGGPLFAKLVKGDIVIVAMLDRLFRSALDLLNTVADLKQRGVGLHILDLGGDMALDGRMKSLKMFANVFSEGEQFRGVGEAVRQRKADDKAKGRYLGGTVPFGFRRVDGKIVKDEAQQKAIAMMVELKADGELSLRGIVAALADEGHKLSHQGVKRILKAHAHDVWGVNFDRDQALLRWADDLGLDEEGHVEEGHDDALVWNDEDAER
jgi:putative DNA-invertase from lambdoid prophage Rac